MKTKLLPLLSIALLCSSVIADVSAREVVKCEKRITPARSKVNIEVKQMTPGALYTSLVSSGGKTAMSTKAANAFGVLRFAYDSNPRDIRAGKKAIPKSFIANEVAVRVTDALGNQVANDPDTTCLIR